jgi:integrase
MYIPILLATMTGLRRGELLSLRWRNLDLDRGLLSVVSSVEQIGTQLREKETKSGKGRVVELSSLLVAELRQHRAKQAESLLRLGIRRTDDHHVVLRDDGQQVKPQRFTAQFQEFLRRHKFRQVRFHDLRHSHASMLLKAGVAAKVTQERLGHSSIAITMDLYSHVMPGLQRQAADLLDADMRAALGRMENKKP